MERPLKNRDVNWLYFNERVLLEAKNPTTPLLERLKFLAIFSSNLDEFFKVRVSQLRQLKKVDKKLRKKLMLKTNKRLKQILKTVIEQQEHFGSIILEVKAALREHNIYIREIPELNTVQKNFIKDYFETTVKASCEVIEECTPAHFKDSAIYLTVLDETVLKAVKIPSEELGRFVTIPGEGFNVMYLDDVLRFNIAHLLPNATAMECFSIKLSRDAALYLDDDYTDKALVDKIYESLSKRSSGQPTRLLYDKAMPTAVLTALRNCLELGEADIVAGGRYHNFSDFFGFPSPPNAAALSYQPRPPLAHPVLSKTKDIFRTIEEKDQLVHFPYQEFGMVENFIQTAALSPEVLRIKMSLYRIAKTSALTDALLTALRNGKEVVLFVEAQARFDEQNNIKWGRIFEEHGATVLYSIPNIKVHSKIALVTREIQGTLQHFAFIGTGNFNAKTAKLYCDHGLFTAHPGITSELDQVFDVLERKIIMPKLKRLLVSPFTTRITFMELIEQEITNARNGVGGKITLKMNSLEDTRMIRLLYKASEAGVEVRLLVRGFCCLLPRSNEEGFEGEKPIYITSIVDRYLEHGRIYLFENAGNERMYIGSADWMTRNLDRRIEVLTPIIDKEVFSELKDILYLQLKDSEKARIIDAEDSNTKVSSSAAETVRSQYAIYDYLKAKIVEEG